MVGTPTLDQIDWAAVLAAISVLLVAYGFVSDAVVRYTAWLIVFTIWMAWFVYFGTKWLYGVEA